MVREWVKTGKTRLAEVEAQESLTFSVTLISVMRVVGY